MNAMDGPGMSNRRTRAGVSLAGCVLGAAQLHESPGPISGIAGLQSKARRRRSSYRAHLDGEGAPAVEIQFHGFCQVRSWNRERHRRLPVRVDLEPRAGDRRGGGKRQGGKGIGSGRGGSRARHAKVYRTRGYFGKSFSRRGAGLVISASSRGPSCRARTDYRRDALRLGPRPARCSSSPGSCRR